jgi:hypothetical protein
LQRQREARQAAQDAADSALMQQFVDAVPGGGVDAN